MKITFVIPIASFAGGIRVVATYARLLESLGHRVTVVSLPWRRPSVHRRLLRLVKGKGRFRPRSSTTLLDFLGDRHVVLERRRPVTADDLPDADVVVATWWETAEWVAALPASKGRSFYLLQDYEVFGHLPTDRVTASYALPLRKLAVSRYVRDKVLQACPGQDISLLPNGVETRQFNAPPRAKNPQLTVGFLYSASPRKRIGLAVDSLLQAKERMPGLRAMSFGQKPPQGLPDWIEYDMLPTQSRIPGIYAACDVWLLTSEHEGFGLPLLEAMACRTPVLATRAGAAEDLIDGHNGFLVEADPAAFASRLQFFADMTDAMWQEASAAAHRTAQDHSWEKATQRLLDYLTQDAPQEPPKQGIAR